MYVGVIRTTNGKEADVFSIPHVCGGDPRCLHVLH